MPKIFRILPLTIIVAVMFLGLKTVDLINGVRLFAISSVEAKEEEKESPVSNTDPSKESDGKNQDEKSKEGDKDKEGGEESAGDEKKNPAVSKEAGTTIDSRFSKVEIELLESLSERRRELEIWEKNIQIKESMLDATEKRIENKIAQIEAMKKQVAMLLEEYNVKEDAKINSLIKIYENMKPAEAARIFDEVEMPILLLVIDGMAEKKAAPILAAMSPKKAKQLTVELANERKINTKITSGIVSKIDNR
ncbi:MAG: hypothetical protein R3D71_04305 [Rickettsiales bacterium]